MKELEPLSRQLAGRYKAIVIIKGTTLPPAFQDAAAFEAELLRDIPHMPKVRCCQGFKISEVQSIRQGSNRFLGCVNPFRCLCAEI